MILASLAIVLIEHGWKKVWIVAVTTIIELGTESADKKPTRLRSDNDARPIRNHADHWPLVVVHS